jgi:PPIC-type PPIASE domain
MKRTTRAFPAILILTTLWGCGGDNTQNLSPDDFYARRSPGVVSPVPRLDHPGILAVPDAHAVAAAPANPEPSSGVPSEISQGDFQPLTSVPPPTTRPIVLTTQPATTQPALATDQFMTLGAVVRVVNDTPIYANKVLRLDAPILRQMARNQDIASFEIDARAQIERTINQLTDDELEIASAERTLDPKDIQLAHALTTVWRNEQISEAGGSEAVARVRAREAGDDFDEEEQDQYRHYLQILYYVRKIDPEIEITAEDERKYYQSHLDEFSTQTSAVIQLIEADPANHRGDRNAARAKLADIRRRVLAGEDFAGYAHTENDLPGATGPDGDGGQMNLQPNTFALTNVDREIWKALPGQISDIIEDQGAFFMFKLVSRQYGATKSFADKAVQDAITKRLSDQQQRLHREEELSRLEKEDPVSYDPQMVDAAVEMALENYPRWRKE